MAERLLVCDNCGALRADDHAALSESCDCGRFWQRCEWASPAHIAAAERVAKLNELLRAVAEMREAQRQYFRGRAPESLTISKLIERRVDKMLADLTDGQKTMFGGDDEQLHD